MPNEMYTARKLARASPKEGQNSPLLIDKRFYGRQGKSTHLLLIRENCVKREPS